MYKKKNIIITGVNGHLGKNLANFTKSALLKISSILLTDFFEIGKDLISLTLLSP